MIDLLLAILRSSTPLLFAALGGMFSERSGVVNIALESFILIGAFTGASIALFSGSPWIGWGAAFVAGVILAAAYALSVIEGRADQIIAGTAFNLFTIGFIPFLSKAIFDSTGSTPSLEMSARFSWEPTIMVAILGLLCFLVIHRTRGGLWISAAGENPQALSTSGVSVRKVRWICVCLSGGLAAWGGATLSLSLASSYSPLMSAGRGFIALAALITGKWKPGPTILACLLFGLAEAIQIRLQGVEVFGFVAPVQWIQILPYVVTLAVLAGLIGQSRAPHAIGKGLQGEEV